MPYRKYNRKKPKRIYKKKTQVNTLALAKKVNQLAKIQRNLRYFVQHRHYITGNLVQNFIASPIMDIPNWTQCFSTNVESRASKYHGTKLNIDFSVDAHTEHSRVDFTCFLASPKNVRVVNECGGAAGTTLTALTADRDYVMYNGGAMMNKFRWNLHKVWRGSTLPVVTEADGSEYINNTNTSRKYMKMNNPLKINNRTQYWDQTDTFSVKPSQRMHLFIFSNNVSTLEGSPRFHANILFNGYCS